MNLTFTLNELLLFQFALFAVFSPFAVIGPYVVMTEAYSSKTKFKVAVRVSIYSTVILILVSWAGEIMLRLLGISVEALGAAGGLVLILSAIPMIMKGESPRKKVNTGKEIDQDEGWETMVVSPLVFPLSIGPGMFTLAITQARMAASIGDRLAITGCIALNGFVILASYLFSVPLVNRLGNKGSGVITRIGGIILLSLAFIIFTNGLKLLLPGLA